MPPHPFLEITIQVETNSTWFKAGTIRLKPSNAEADPFDELALDHRHHRDRAVLTGQFWDGGAQAGSIAYAILAPRVRDDLVVDGGASDFEGHHEGNIFVFHAHQGLINQCCVFGRQDGSDNRTDMEVHSPATIGGLGLVELSPGQQQGNQGYEEGCYGNGQ